MSGTSFFKIVFPRKTLEIHKNTHFFFKGKYYHIIRLHNMHHKKDKKKEDLFEAPKATAAGHDDEKQVAIAVDVIVSFFGTFIIGVTLKG